METREVKRNVQSGWVWLVLAILALPAIGLAAYFAIKNVHITGIILSAFALAIWVILQFGFFTLQPNMAAVLILFGDYRGTVVTPGFHWANPFYIKKKVSLRAQNLAGETLKVNDSRGNPIEISLVVVWRVVDTAKAVFDVDHHKSYVSIQSEAALRHLAMKYPYDTFEDETLSLRGSVDEISLALLEEVQDRVARAGVEIEEARISHLAYASEIAGAMLRRQQADAIVAARRRIVDGAVGMVEMALDQLQEHETVKLDEERTAAMVSNLLVVLCGDRDAQPVVNTGTLYH